MADLTDNRSISIQESAIGSTLVSGDGNQVIIYQYQTERRELPAVQSESIPATLGANPYKGLLAFQETDSDRYFGRETEIYILWQKLRSLYESETNLRLLPIYGPSGSGKSSLVRAGLIPELARQSLPGQDKAQVAVLVPMVHPLESLATVLARAVTGDIAPVAKTREFKAELQQPNHEGDYDGLRRIASALPGITTSPLIVLVDQFEEVYSLCEKEEERNAFVANLLYAAADRSRQVLVIITLRSDFLGQIQQHPQLNHLFSSQGFLVPAISADNLQAAIAKPAEQAGYALDEATIQLLIEQTAGREGSLPLLQFALTRIWEGLEAGVAPATTLEQIGGVGGALAGEAQRVYDELTEKQQAIARRIFVGLVQLGEGTRDTRRRVELERLRAQQDDEADFRTVLNRFSAPGVRLITLAAIAEGTDTAEVTHEALFEHWKLSKVWIAQNRDDIRFQRRLQDAAQHWDDQARPDGLLWRPPDLDLLKRFHQRASHEMTLLELEFFKTSVGAIERNERERKRQRQRTIAGLTGGLAGAVVLAAIAGAGWWQATSAATNERIKALVFEAQSLFALSGAEYNFNERSADISEEVAKKKQSLLQEASLKAIKAGRELQDARGVELGTRLQVLSALQQIVGTEVKPTAFTLSECEPFKRGTFSLTWSSDQQTIACVNYDGTVRFWDGRTGKKTAVFHGDSEWVDDVVFSPDGKMVASGTVDGTVKLWERATGKEIRSLKGHLSQVSSIRFSSNGKTIAAANYDGTITLWEVATGQELKTLPGHSDLDHSDIRGFFFSPNSQFIVSLGIGNDPIHHILKLWDVSTGKELKTFHLKTQPPEIDFSSNSQTLAYSTGELENQSVRFWSIPEKRELRNIPVSGNPFFSPDGRVIAVIDYRAVDYEDLHPNKTTTSCQECSVSLWDASTGKKIKTLSDFPGWLSGIDFSSDGNLIATIASTGGDDGLMSFPTPTSKVVIDLWSHTGEKLKTFEQPGKINSSNFSPNNQKIVISSFAKIDGDWHIIVKLWDVLTGRPLKTLSDELIDFSPEGLSVGLVSRFSPDGQTIVVINSSGTAKFFDSSTGTELNLPNVSPSRDIDRPPILSESGNSSITLRTDGSMRIQNRSTGKEIKANRWDVVLTSDVYIGDDDKTITTVNWYGELQKRDLATGKILNSINLPFSKLTSRLEFSPDGRRVAAAMSDNTVKIWDATTNKEIITLKGYASQASLAWVKNELQFSPDGTVVAALGSDSEMFSSDKARLELWEVSTGKAIQLSETPSRVQNISFSHTSDELAILKTDNTIELWKLSTRQLLKTIRPPLSSVNHIQFDDSSKILFVLGSSELKMLDIETAQEIASFNPPDHLSIKSIDFNADGQTLILQSENQFAFLNLNLEDLLKHSCNIVRDFLKSSPNVNESDRHLCDSSTVR